MLVHHSRSICFKAAIGWYTSIRGPAQRITLRMRSFMSGR